MITDDVFFVAEMSGNHQGSLAKALDIITAAADSGCDAVKFQTFKPELLAAPNYKIREKESPWFNSDLQDLYAGTYTPWEWHEQLFSHAQKKGIIAFSTPFHEEAVDFLESLENPFYKVASFDNTHKPLLERIAKTRKSIIMSIGLATKKEIQDAIWVLRKQDVPEIVLLKCTTNYPAKTEDANLITLVDIFNTFHVSAGLSDHTLGDAVALASIPLGAKVIEKHFTLRRSDGSTDCTFSMEPKEMEQMIQKGKEIRRAVGKVSYGPGKGDRQNLLYRRSLYAVQDIQPGQVLNNENVKCLRPALGIPSYQYQNYLGKKVTEFVKRGTLLKPKMVL